MTLVELFDQFSPGAGRVLATLHTFGMSLFQHADEQELFRSLCDALVSAGYRRALIGQPIDVQRTRIRPIVRSGADDLSTEIDLSWGPIAPVKRLQGSPFSPMTPIVARDILRDPRYEPWRDDAKTHGYAAVLAFTVTVGSTPWGTLVIYAAEPDAFDEGERALLEMLVGHLSFSLESLHRQVALVESEKNYRQLIENIHDIVFRVDARGFLTYISPVVERLVGWTPAESIGHHFMEVILSEDVTTAQRLFAELMAGRRCSAEWRVKSKSGDIHIFRASAIPKQSDSDPFVGIARDITEQKRVEAKLLTAFEGTIKALGVVTVARDPYTAGHQERVAQLACAIAEDMTLDQERIRALQYAGLVHDIGKMSVPSEILTKPSRLTDAEQILLQCHPQVAYDVLKKIEFPWPIADIVHQHHERMNGSGYPQGLVGDEILLEARILAVADVVEAMASHRPYRPALGIKAALKEITEKRGILYDSDVVRTCNDLFSRGAFRFGKR